MCTDFPCLQVVNVKDFRGSSGRLHISVFGAYHHSGCGGLCLLGVRERVHIDEGMSWMMVCGVAEGLCGDGGSDLSEGWWPWNERMGGEAGSNHVRCE